MIAVKKHDYSTVQPAAVKLAKPNAYSVNLRSNDCLVLMYSLIIKDF